MQAAGTNGFVKWQLANSGFQAAFPAISAMKWNQQNSYMNSDRRNKDDG
jgi:hypothetical protein